MDMYTMDMKSVVVLALTLWTVSSPALAALGASCSSDADCDGSANEVCDVPNNNCVCSAAYKTNGGGDGCDPKGLTDACTVDADCADDTNAVCDGTSNTCVCSAAYKANAAGDACVAKSIRTECVAAGGDTLAYCTDATLGDPNAVCGTTDCECSAAYKAVSDVCVAKGLTDACTVVADCVGVTNAVCDGTSTVCVCSGAYKDNAAGDGCVAKENGARGMTANIGLLCAILMMLSYVNTL